MRPADFAVEPFFGAGVTHDVHVGGAGPVVIVMHELGGLSPVALDFGCQVVDRGYRVVMPRFFGRPRQDSDLKGFVQICIAREFTLLRKNRTSKVTRWLRCLAQKYDDGKGVAAIGMCATGGLVLGLMLEDGVVAGVASQPSLPFAPSFWPTARRASLGLDQSDLDELVTLKKPLMALRFENDWICPAQRVEAMHEVLGALTQDVSTEGSPHRAHSVLTYHHVPVPGHPSHDAYLAVLEFLESNLKPQVSGAPHEGGP